MTTTNTDRHIVVVVYRDHAGKVCVSKMYCASYTAGENVAKTFRRVLSVTIVRAEEN